MKAVIQILVSSIFVISPVFIQAQSLERSVVSSTGDYFQNSTLQVSWSVGEVVIESFTGNQSQLDQGFHQALADVINLAENLGTGTPSLYPNPFTDKLTVSEIPGGNTTIMLFQADGKELKRIQGLNQREMEFFWYDLPEGSYFLLVTNKDQRNIFNLSKAP